MNNCSVIISRKTQNINMYEGPRYVVKNTTLWFPYGQSYKRAFRLSKTASHRVYGLRRGEELVSNAHPKIFFIPTHGSVLDR
jgi:hypothetical protein